MILKGKAHLSTIALVTVAMFDLITTLMWLHAGQAEGNPVFNYFARRGGFVLVGAKLAFLIGPLLLLEIARKSRPRSAEIGTWIAAIAYAYLWGSHVLSLPR